MREAVLGSRHFFFSSRHIFLIFAPPLHRAFIFFSHLILAPLVKTIRTTKKIAPLSCIYIKILPITCLLNVPCLLAPVSCLTSPVSCLLSPVSHLRSQVSCLTAPVSHLLSLGSCVTYPVPSLMSGLTPPVSSLLSPVFCLMSPVSCA